MRIRAVIIGFAHMHVNEIALHISEQPNMKLVGIADALSGVEQLEPYRYTPMWNKKNIMESYCPYYFDDYCEMLDVLTPDIAFIFTENSLKPMVVEQCAKRKINIVIEKPIAVSLNQAILIENTVRENGVEAMINWPIMWRSYMHKLKRIVDSEIVGKPIKLHYINGHTGPLDIGAKHRGVSESVQKMSDDTIAKTWWHQNVFGGGVFLNICSYGCFLSKWLLGDGEEGVLSYGANLNTPYGDTADNCAAIVKYKDKMSVIEGTWTTPRVVIPSGPTVVCTNGVVMCTGGAENTPDVKVYDMYGSEVKVPNIEFEVKYKNMPEHYVNHVLTGEPIHEMLTLDKNMEIMAILEAAIKSSATCKEQKIYEY